MEDWGSAGSYDGMPGLSARSCSTQRRSQSPWAWADWSIKAELFPWWISMAVGQKTSPNLPKHVCLTLLFSHPGGPGRTPQRCKAYSRARLVLSSVVLRVARNLSAPAEVACKERLLFRLFPPTPPTAGRAVVVVPIIALSSAAVALRLEVWVRYEGQCLQDGATGARRRRWR
jgi:hypothetical protein